MDTASLSFAVVRRCYGLEDQPFTLAIAGYGTGKSHLGLTLATLLSAPDSKGASNILSAIKDADADIGSKIKNLLQETKQPCIVLALNGMQTFDLTAEITQQIIRIVKADGYNPKPLDDLRPRFRQAASLIRLSNQATLKDLVVYCEFSSAEELLTGLEQQDELVYTKVHAFFAARGMPIRVISGESIRDVIDVTVREYCGKDKPYRCLLILFDEFGKYTEFATVRSQIAGSGVLQDLFEAIQSNANSVCFVGFIQFELNAYVQRVAPEYKNEILRYMDRYQLAANKVYLSVNLETLIANLIEKRQRKLLDKWFDNKQAKNDSEIILDNLARWFPQSKNHRLWHDLDQFHTVIRKGCWPLSPYSTWFLFYLAAAGKHLQERSALSLLEDAFCRHYKFESSDTKEWLLFPVDLWSDVLQQELISSEETGQQGAITHAYASVMERHGARLSPELRRLLSAVVVASKLSLQATNKGDAIDALTNLAGLDSDVANSGIRSLQEEYNILEWDEVFNTFDILGDAIPRSQFLSFVSQRVASSYDEAGKAKLFASKAAEWCDLLIDLECDFAEENKITTREWRYEAITTNLDYLPNQINMARERWTNAFGVDEPRGTIIYTYVEPSRVLNSVIADTSKLLKAAAREAQVADLPIMVVLLCDEMGALGQALAEYAVLEESINEEDRVKFGNLVGAHKEKLHQTIHEQIESMVKHRKYVTGLKEDLEAHKLGRVGTELFTKIYKSPIPFPFDGFSTAKGNAAETCNELTLELLGGRLDYDSIIAKPVKSKNRAVTVLKDTWGIFTKNGNVSRRPSLPIICRITEKWDDALASNEQRLPVADAICQLCRPPYGANIASAGLLLSVFVAPRSEKLIAVRNGQQLAISQLAQDDLFRGKFIDLLALRGVDFVLLGEMSSEWEALLDEWEQTENHLGHKSCLERSLELKKRMPVPPSLVYRELHFHEKAKASVEAIQKMDKDQNEATLKIVNGEERADVSLLTWGAAEVKKICDKMINEKPLWTDSQISELQPHYEMARQSIILHFSDWLNRQGPKADTPDAVGDFKHKMLHLVGGGLEKIGLETQRQQLEIYTSQRIRNVETSAEARQLTRDIKSWLMSHGNVMRLLRIAEIRGLKQAGNEYLRKLQGMAERIQLQEIAETRLQLSEFIIKLKDAESEVVKRASAIRRTKICLETNIDGILTEIDALIPAFENLPVDLEDLQLMRLVMKFYQNGSRRLRDNNLSWTEFENIANEIKNEHNINFGEKELPWLIDEIVDGFVQDISKHRKEASAEWIGELEKMQSAISAMSANEANSLHKRIVNPPPFITDPHRKRLANIVKKVEARLNTLSIEWLIEKFKELSDRGKKEFMNRVGKIMDKKK